jgi:Methionine synthase I, cobalamin-binding domain
MKNILISEEAYKEFKNFVESYNLSCNYLRIGYIKRKYSDSAFTISIGEPRVNDIVEEIGDIKFIMNSNLVTEYGGVVILSNKENNNQGLLLKPKNEYVENYSNYACC